MPFEILLLISTISDLQLVKSVADIAEDES